MPSTDTSRRLRPGYIDQDVDSMRGARTIPGYTSARPETTLEGLQSSYAEMIAAQESETEIMVRAKAAAAKVRLAEWRFHQNVLAMKALVRGATAPTATKPRPSATKKRLSASEPGNRRPSSQSS